MLDVYFLSDVYLLTTSVIQGLAMWALHEDVLCSISELTNLGNEVF